MNNPTPLTLDRPLTWNEVYKLKDKEYFIEALVRIDLDDLISHDMDYLNTFVSERIMPEDDIVGLEDLHYNVQGAVPGMTPLSWGNGAVILHVCGSVESALKEHAPEEADDEEEEEENDAWAPAREWMSEYKKEDE